MKVGDPTTFPLQLTTIYGVPLRYLTLAAFLADGWSLECTILGAVVTLTTSALIPDPAKADGMHLLTFTVPAQGVVFIRATNPSPLYVSGINPFLDVSVADLDSLAAQINAGVGTPVSGGSVTTVNDLPLVEGDGAQASYTIPASALKVFDNSGKLIFSFATLADVAATSWTIAAQARYTTENGELPSNAVAFSFQAQVLNKATNLVGIGWQTAPAGAIVDDLLPGAPTVTVSGGAVTGATGGTGGHIYGTNAVTVTLTPTSGGTGAVLTAVIDRNGAITGYTVTSAGSAYAAAPTAALSVASDGSVSVRRFAFDIQLVPPTGSGYAAKLTVITAFVALQRQQTTTP